MSILTAGQIMDSAASMNNDSAKQVCNYTVQIPYLNMALRELKEHFELNNVPVTDAVSVELEILAGVNEIGFAPDIIDPDVTYLPDDFIEPKLVHTGHNGIYTPITRLNVLPLYDETTQLSQISAYVWAGQAIRFIATNQTNLMKIDYIRDIFPIVTSEEDSLNVINAMTFLSYKTAALLARLVYENATRADSLDNSALLGIERATGIGTKGKQAITTRRRPFRRSYKNR